jgi:hypothetical protein
MTELIILTDRYLPAVRESESLLQVLFILRGEVDRICLRFLKESDTSAVYVDSALHHIH